MEKDCTTKVRSNTVQSKTAIKMIVHSISAR